MLAFNQNDNTSAALQGRTTRKVVHNSLVAHVAVAVVVVIVVVVVPGRRRRRQSPLSLIKLAQPIDFPQFSARCDFLSILGSNVGGRGG